MAAPVLSSGTKRHKAALASPERLRVLGDLREKHRFYSFDDYN
jgi:hypothetical protein